MTMDEKYAEDLLKWLKSYFEQMLTVKNDMPIEEQLHPPVTHENLYRHAYTLVLHNRGEMLYSGFQEVVMKHLVEKVSNGVNYSWTSIRWPSTGKKEEAA